MVPKKSSSPISVKLSDLPLAHRTSEVLDLVRPSDLPDVPGFQDRLVEAYYGERGSLPKVCKTLGLSYLSLKKLIKDNPPLKEAIRGVDEILADEVHQLFLERVLDPTDRHPAWKIFYLKKNVPLYADRPPSEKAIQINLTFQDNTLKPTKAIKAPKVIDIEPTVD